MSVEQTAVADIPTPEAVARRQLAQAPKWVQRLASNTLSIIAWIGLPSTLLSTFSNMQFVVDGALWLYRHAGELRPILGAMGEGLVLVVGLWRDLTHPLWQTLFGWLHLTLPTWAPDVLTLLLLFGVGFTRRVIAASWANFLSGAGLIRGATEGNSFQPIPRSFPYKTHFEENGFNLPPRRLRDTQRLWRKWRKSQIRLGLDLSAAEWPRFPESAIRAQFGWYWLGVMRGRRAMLIYVAAGLMIAAACAVDWAYQTNLLR